MNTMPILQKTDEALQERIPDNLAATRHSVTYRFNDPWILDPTVRPESPCYSCDGSQYWQRADGGWVCSACHPQPVPDQ